ncbi:MAG TPA: nucleoside hydrolase [Thermohalobaculum sp.]|nr:nucleoside hydrolase [Thermohalobaculum sp.]
MRKLIIDTDPGIDDAMAIFYAAAHPGLELIGLTSVFGNVPVAVATRNALRLAELTGQPIPVAEGAAAPMVQPLQPHPDFVHGAEGLGDIPPEAPRGRPDPRPAARFLSESCAAHPGEVTICAVGPLTNLAAALAQYPAIVRDVGHVVVMGGAVECPGNVNADAEANIWNDPHAAAAVFAADWPVTLVGLDITERVNCSPADFAGLGRAAPVIGGFLNDAVQFYIHFHRQRHGLDGCHMHDPTAVVAITDPALFDIREAPLAVTLDGEAAGRTRAAPGAPAPPVRIVLGGDLDAIRRRFLEVMATADACRHAALGAR